MFTARMRFAVLFLSPAFLLYTVFVFLPILGTGYYSLTNWRLGREVEFVGLLNYANLLKDKQYWQVAANSLTLIGAAVLIQVPVAFGIAYALHLVAFGFRFYRSILFLPVVLAAVAIGLIFTVFYNGDVGAANELLDRLGLGGLKRSWLSDSSVVLWAVNIPNLWHHLGLFIIIFVAAMRGIPAELFEAAAVDGAGRIRILFAIVMPLMRDVILICIILAATTAIRAFDHSWIMTQGGPGQASSYFATLIYKRGFLDGQLAYASTIAVTLFAYVLLLVAILRVILIRRQS